MQEIIKTKLDIIKGLIQFDFIFINKEMEKVLINAESAVINGFSSKRGFVRLEKKMHEMIDIGVKNVKINKLEGIGEIVSPHYEIKIGNDNVAVVYEPLACHSYNTITQHGNDVNIATIDTMLSFYLAFLYIDQPLYNYNPDRILCMSHFLFEVQQKNRLKQKGLLKRFSLNCIGHQETIEEMRAEKAAKFKELKDKKQGDEYEEYFLRYRPSDNAKKRGANEELAQGAVEHKARTQKAPAREKAPHKKTRKTRKTKTGLFAIFK